MTNRTAETSPLVYVRSLSTLRKYATALAKRVEVHLF